MSFSSFSSRFWVLFVASCSLAGTVRAQSYTVSTIDPTSSFQGSYFFDSNFGFAVGFNGTGVIRKTTDGGQTWSTLVSGTSNSLYEIFFLDANRGWVVGEGGTIRKTTNGGDSWSATTSPTGSGTIRFYDVHFPDISNPNTGYVVGTNGFIAKTTDGATWTQKISGVTDWIMGLHFTSPTTGCASTNNGKILRTTDSGETWTLINTGTGESLHDITFVDANTGYAVGNAGVIAKTSNGGVSWTLQTSNTANLLTRVSFSDANNGFAIGGNGTVVKTTNGGTTWTVQTTGTTVSFEAMSMPTANTGYFIGTNQLVKFQAVAEPAAQPSTISFLDVFGTSMSVSFAAAAGPPAGYLAIRKTGASAAVSDPLDGVAYTEGQTLGDGVVAYSGSGNAFSQESLTASTQYTYKIYSYNGAGTAINYRTATPLVGSQSTFASGQAWTQVDDPNLTAYDVHFGSATVGASVGAYTLRTTLNGGTTWTERFAGNGDIYSGVHFPTASVGYIVGDRGAQPTIRKSTDSGVTWTDLTPLGTNSFADVCFTDANTGYVVGSAGTIQKTTNGGTTWTAQTSGTTSNLRSIMFVNATTGYVVGGGGVILKTTNGGTTWTTLTSGVGVELVGVHFVSATTGYVVGNAGTILKTTNGSSWVAITNPASDVLNGVYFTDANNGYVVGNFGVILKTTNGGASWLSMSTNTASDNNLLAIYSMSADKSVAVGQRTFIYQSVPEPSSQPTALAFSSVTSTSFTVSFGAAAGTPTGYIVLRKAGSASAASPADGTTYTAGATVGDATVAYVGSALSFNETALTPATQYFYQVFTYNSSANPSSINYLVNFPLSGSQTTIAATPSAQPTNLQFTAPTTTGFTVGFTAATGTPTGYLVLRQQGSAPSVDPVNGTTYAVNGAIGSATVVSINASVSIPQSALAAGTTYFFKVYAFNGTGAAINYLKTAPLAGSYATLPNAPTSSPASTITQTSFIANWAVVTGATGYRLDVTSGDFTVNEVGYDNRDVSTATSFNVTGLAAGTTYRFRVRAYNTSGVSVNSAAITQVTIPATVVANVASSVGQTTFTASWSSALGATSYLLDVSTDNFVTFITGYNGKTISGTTEAIIGLTPGMTFQYRVRSTNAGGTSPNSNAISQLLIPATPIAVDAANIRSTDFIAKWQDVDSETGYELDVSADDFVTFIIGYQAKALAAGVVQADVTGLQGNTAYKYRVRAKNATGTTPSSNVIQVTTQQSTGSNGLVLTPTFPTTFKAGVSATASVSVSGGSGTPTVKLMSRGLLAASFQPTDATSKGNGQFEVAITSTMVDALGAELYFTATDASSTVNSTRGNIYVLNDASLSIPFGSGMDGSSGTYQMFSVPYVLNDKGIATVFDELGAYDKTKWKFFRYQGGRLVENENGLNNIEVGKGYWFNTVLSDEIKVGEGSVAVQGTSGQAFSMSYEKGWNQIGNPYPFAIDWQAIKDANPDAGLNSLWQFQGGSYVKATALSPWKGAFVFSDNGGTITFPFSAKSSGRTVDPLTIDGNWKLDLSLTVGSLSASGGIGMHRNASTSKDKYDDLCPPRWIDFVELTTSHSDFGSSDFSFDIVPLTKTHKWSFVATSNQTGPASIEWDLAKIPDGNASYILVDKTLATWVDMKLSSSYSFDLRGTHSLEIVYDSDGDFHFEHAMMGQAWPNPFSESLSIPVAVSEENLNTQLMIYDLMGRPVHQSDHQFPAAGVYHLEWNGRDNQGQVVAPGLLFYQVTGSVSKRVVKIK